VPAAIGRQFKTLGPCTPTRLGAVSTDPSWQWVGFSAKKLQSSPATDINKGGIANTTANFLHFVGWLLNDSATKITFC
jgi:hypothetical protein